MISFEESIVIERPVEHVFAYLSDSKNEAKWGSGVVDLRQSPEGPMRAGTQLTEVRNFLGARIESLSEITEYEPNKKIVRKGSNGKFAMEGSFRFEPMAQSTKLIWTMQMEPGGVFKLAEPLVASALKRDSVGNLKTLKGLLEA